MSQQANVNETLPSQGDAINELFAQHYRASLRTACGTGLAYAGRMIHPAGVTGTPPCKGNS